MPMVPTGRRVLPVPSVRLAPLVLMERLVRLVPMGRRVLPVLMVTMEPPVLLVLLVLMGRLVRLVR